MEINGVDGVKKFKNIKSKNKRINRYMKKEDEEKL